MMGKKYAGATRLAQAQSTKSLYEGALPDEAQGRLDIPVAATLAMSSEINQMFLMPFSVEMQQKARDIVDRAFQSFADHSQRLAADLAEFDKKREEVRGEIKRGARRTNGRII